MARTQMLLNTTSPHWRGRGKGVSFHKEGLSSGWAGRAAAGLQALWGTFWHMNLSLSHVQFFINIFAVNVAFYNILLFLVNCSYLYLLSFPSVPPIRCSSPAYSRGEGEGREGNGKVACGFSGSTKLENTLP